MCQLVRLNLEIITSIFKNYLENKFLEIKSLNCFLINEINISLNAAYHFSGLNIAKVIQLYKTANVGSVANYRPISLLPLINKIFEKLLLLNNFLESCNIISQNQFGFHKSKDTQRATYTTG